MDQPNPGSDQALDQGCICPVLDNCHGRFAPFPATTAADGRELPEAWYIHAECSMHGYEAGNGR